VVPPDPPSGSNSSNQSDPIPLDQTRLRASDATRINDARVNTLVVDPQPDEQWADPLQLGHLLGNRYRLERELGAGGMGTVYFASDQEVEGEFFAVKVLKSEIRDYPDSLPLLREEVRKTRSLQHPNIVGVYSLNSDHGEVYVLMEYLHGKSLMTLLQEDFGRGMQLQRAWPLIEDICAALAFAHDHNVIHSDLKPANVFITTSGRAKLLDFGIARVARGRRSNVDPGALGALTPAYASCEMLQGFEPDERDDVYGLGCVIYEMLSGRHPFGGHSSIEARDAGMIPASLPALSRVQNASLARALSFDRAARTQSVEAVLAGLQPAGPSRSRSLLWVSAALGALIAATAIGMLWVHPAASPVPRYSITRARSLADRARALSVDRSDRALQEGTRLLAEAEKQARAGGSSEGTPTLTQAITELSAAILGGKRFARLGSSPEEVNLAMNLCKEKADACEATNFDGEAPRLAVLAPFELDHSGVSNREFAAFVTANNYRTRGEIDNGLYMPDGLNSAFRPGYSWKTLRDSSVAPGADSSNYPVRGIDFESAKAYCTWRGQRLPTEDEWEFVARSADHRLFPWGNDPKLGDTGATHPSARALAALDQQPVTGRFGTRGLGGALWEWAMPHEGTVPVLRGASWLETDLVRERLAARRTVEPSHGIGDVGFRCVKSTDSWPEG
jgi:hypothetical protein